MKPAVRLIAELNDPNLNQEKLRQKLEPEAGKYLDSYLMVEKPNASRSVLHSLLTNWLAGRECKVRFEIEVDGKIRSKEVTNLKELDELIGDGKTPSTLLRALGKAGQVPSAKKETTA
jgi:hypothetical protein